MTYLKILKEKKIHPTSIPKVVLYSKHFEETIFFNCLYDFEMHLKCSNLFFVANYLFCKYTHNLLGITNNLDDLSTGDIIYIDNTTNQDIVFCKKISDKNLHLIRDFEENIFYPIVEEINIKLSF